MVEVAKALAGGARQRCHVARAVRLSAATVVDLHQQALFRPLCRPLDALGIEPGVVAQRQSDLAQFLVEQLVDLVPGAGIGQDTAEGHGDGQQREQREQQPAADRMHQPAASRSPSV